MKLAKCPQCNKLINIDELEVLDPETIIGCGLKEDDFDYCTKCAGNGNAKLCEEIRTDEGLTYTKVKDVEDNVEDNGEAIP